VSQLAWIVVFLFAGVHLPAHAATLGDFAGALAPRAGAGYSANNWNALTPIKGVKWRDTTLKEAPGAFAQEGDFTLDGHGRATVLVVGARQMMFDAEIVLSKSLDKSDLARTLKAQFSPATLIEQIGGDCRTAAVPGGWRVYRLTLPGKRALFMQVEFTAGTNTKVGGTRLTLSIDNKPAWAC
jgi:hypothetical protein